MYECPHHISGFKPGYEGVEKVPRRHATFTKMSYLIACLQIYFSTYEATIQFMFWSVCNFQASDTSRGRFAEFVLPGPEIYTRQGQ